MENNKLHLIFCWNKNVLTMDILAEMFVNDKWCYSNQCSHFNRRSFKRSFSHFVGFSWTAIRYGAYVVKQSSNKRVTIFLDQLMNLSNKCLNIYFILFSVSINLPTKHTYTHTPKIAMWKLWTFSCNKHTHEIMIFMLIVRILSTKVHLWTILMVAMECLPES